MVKQSHKLSLEDMQQLAERLIKMRFEKARWHLIRIDRGAKMQVWRDEIGSEIQTKYKMPNLGVMVTLVEHNRVTPKGSDGDKLRSEKVFVEARVEPL